MSAVPSPSPAASATTATAPAVPSNVELLKVKNSLLGVHTWYQQVLNGYPVVDGLYAQHLATKGEDAGQTTVWDGRVAVGTLADTDAAISSATATAAAVAYTGGKALTFVAPSLWVLPGAETRLVWSVSTVTTGAGAGAHLSYVDAQTGKVLKDVIESKLESAPDAKFVTGRAKVFDPNPVVKLQDEDLTDQGDSDAAVPKEGYSKRDLRHLDQSHTLVGKWAKVVNSDLASSPDNKYMFKRSNDDFEQVMDYYALDTEESYYQKLGFDNVNAEAQKIEANAMADDNSWYIPSQDLIQTGTGGVDDAEDPEVVWHEGGHATQDDQVPHFGQGLEAGSIGEAYGDYIAVTLSQEFGKDTALTPTWCVMDWDSVSYTGGPMHCLRTTEAGKHYPEDMEGEVHADGEIWSQALWDMNKALGRDKATTAIVEATFNFAPNTSFFDAAKATVRATKTLYGAAAADKATKAFHDRGIL
jgi:Zn-dependent metalloprotease